MRLPARVSRLRWLRLHWSASLLVLVDLGLILLHILIVMFGHTSLLVLWRHGPPFLRLLVVLLRVAVVSNVGIGRVLSSVVEGILGGPWLLGEALMRLIVEVIIVNHMCIFGRVAIRDRGRYL